MVEVEKTEEMKPEEFYNIYGEEEWERLEKSFWNKMEFESTIHYLEKYLPEGGKVLDAGGGPGRYSLWLAEKGYEVTLLDLSEEQLKIAEEKIEEHEKEEKIETMKGDIRDLKMDESSYDAVLCLGGPLSHIIESEERKKAIKELKRLAKDKAPILVSVMGMIPIIPSIIEKYPEEVVLLPEFLETGNYTAEMVKKHGLEPTFAEAHFYRRKELKEELEKEGLEVEKIVGLEGPIRECEEIDELEESKKDILEKVVARTREDPAITDISSHMLAIAVK